MNRAQLTRFATLSAALRASLFGSEFLLGTTTFCAAINAVTKSRTLEAGGWMEGVTATLRVSRAEITRRSLTFTLGLVITQGTSASYRIAEIRDNPGAPELVLGLAQDLSRA